MQTSSPLTRFRSPVRAKSAGERTDFGRPPRTSRQERVGRTPIQASPAPVRVADAGFLGIAYCRGRTTGSRPGSSVGRAHD